MVRVVQRNLFIRDELTAYDILSREMRGVGRFSIDLRLVFFKASFLYVFSQKNIPKRHKRRGTFLMQQKVGDWCSCSKKLCLTGNPRRRPQSR